MDPSKLTLGFGKHRDDPLEDIPGDYIQWVLENVDLQERCRDLAPLIEDELKKQLLLKTGQGVVRKGGRSHKAPHPPPIPRERMQELRNRLEKAKQGKPQEAPGEPDVPYQGDPLPYVASCASCGRTAPVADKQTVLCICGATIEPVRPRARSG